MPKQSVLFSKFFISVILFPLILLSSNLSSAALRQSKNVLVLHSYHKGLSWTEQIVNGIESTFSRSLNKGTNLIIDYEYMDTKRFVDESYYKKLYDIYKQKSLKLKYDVIINADDNALNFLLKYRDEIFGKVPVVFCGVNFYEESLLQGHDLYTGVVEAFDIKDTIDIALKLHPGANKFVVVGDSTTTSLRNKLAVEKVAPEYEHKGVSFTYLNAGDIMLYQRDLQNMTQGTIALAMLFNRDNDGRFYTYEESFDIYSTNVKIPIYTFWDFYLDRGAVGGKIISGFAQGEEAAKMALQILNGQKVENIPVLKKSPNKYVFDYNVLKKFNVDLADLPGDSTIINKPYSLFELYKQHKAMFLGTLAFVLFLILVIFILLANILKRKRVERKLLETNISYNRFVPHTFLDLLEKYNILDVELGDQMQKEMTVMFSDIRSFTSLSEKMSPKETFNFLNSYLKDVSPIIRHFNGFIDKYIGDSIMALFPVKAEDAVKAGISIQKQVFDFNLQRKKSGYEPIKIGVGIHTGTLMLGTIGEQERMEGTVISDAVNLSSRLESLTKLYGAAIIISGDVLENLGVRKNKYFYRFLGKIKVKGKDKSIDIFEIIDGHLTEIAELKIRSKPDFEKGMQAYFDKDFASAVAMFEKVLEINKKDKAVDRYLDHARYFRDNGVPDNWDGVDKMEIK